MLPDRVSNPGPLTYESGALPTALRGPSRQVHDQMLASSKHDLPVLINTDMYFVEWLVGCMALTAL